MGPPILDPFLIGSAVRGSEVRVVYGYNSIKADLMSTHPGDYKALLEELRRRTECGSGVLFLQSFPPLELRDRIRAGRIRVWDDRLTKALMGLCMENGEIVAAGYSYPRAVECIMASQRSSGDVNARLEAMEFLDRNVIPADLGEDTPYFITPVG